jgi:signal peptidase I
VTDRLREAALWTGAVLGLLLVVAGTAVMFFGYTFLIFRSGSMGPEIPTGSLALARTTPAAELEAGDVVSVLAANGARVTHRLVSSTVRGDEASLILRGDANATPDEEIYQVTSVERSIVSVPYAGYVATVLLSPAGLVAAGCLGGILLLMGFGSADDRRGGPPASGGGRHRAPQKRNRGPLASAGVGLSLVGAVAVAAGAVGTTAFFTDPATLRSGSFSAGSVAPPTNLRCVPDGNDSYITWSAPVGAPPTSYRVTWTSSDGSSGQADFATVVQYQPPAGGFLRNPTYTVRVSAVRGNWVSVASDPDTIRTRGLFGSNYQC